MRAADLSDELTRQRARVLVANMQRQSALDLVDSLAERLSHLLAALTECDPLAYEDPEPMHNLAAAITAARQALDDLNAEDKS